MIDERAARNTRGSSLGGAWGQPDRAPTELELAAALATSLDASFERLVLAYQDRLYAFALRLTGCPADAEEIAQDALVRAYRALARYPAEQVRALALRPWLFQITLNVWRNGRRTPRVPTVTLAPTDDPDGASSEPVADPRERPEVVAEQREARAELATLLLQLPERYRVAVVLRHVEGLGYGELAALLKRPVGTAKSDVHRGVRLLREARERRMIPAERDGAGSWKLGDSADRPPTFAPGATTPGKSRIGKGG